MRKTQARIRVVQLRGMIGKAVSTWMKDHPTDRHEYKELYNEAYLHILQTIVDKPQSYLYLTPSLAYSMAYQHCTGWTLSDNHALHPPGESMRRPGVKEGDIFFHPGAWVIEKDKDGDTIKQWINGELGVKRLPSGAQRIRELLAILDPDVIPFDESTKGAKEKAREMAKREKDSENYRIDIIDAIFLTWPRSHFRALGCKRFGLTDDETEALLKNMGEKNPRRILAEMRERLLELLTRLKYKD